MHIGVIKYGDPSGSLFLDLLKIQNNFTYCKRSERSLIVCNTYMHRTYVFKSFKLHECLMTIPYGAETGILSSTVTRPINVVVHDCKILCLTDNI